MDGNDSNQDLGASFLTEGQFLVQSDDGNYPTSYTCYKMLRDSNMFCLHCALFSFLGENSMAGDNADDSGDGSDRSTCYLREQDRFLPIANVARIMKKTIPRTGNVFSICISDKVVYFIFISN